MSDKKIREDVELVSNSPDDQRLLKKWGYISAYPHEYLIHFRDGKLNQKSSGQGATCFKMPSDTIFIIPTSLKEIVFKANQLTLDNVDVQIRGMAVYRINRPLQIYTLLNFSSRLRAEEKLANMIGDLCRSTAKWLVANMNLEECIRKRKEEIAETLRREVTQVVADNEKGWGVEINTIDIQDVYIQDEEIFNSMQITFKASKRRESELALLEVNSELENKKLEKEQEFAQLRKQKELKQLEIEKELEIKKLEHEISLSEIRKDNEMKNAQYQFELKAEEIQLATQQDKKQFELDLFRVEEQEKIEGYKLEQILHRDKQEFLLEQEKEQENLKLEKQKSEQHVQTLKQHIEIENMASPASLQSNFIENALPQIAEALTKNMKDVRFNVFQQDGEKSGGSPFRFILMEVLQILQDRIELAKPSSEGSQTEE